VRIFRNSLISLPSKLADRKLQGHWFLLFRSGPRRGRDPTIRLVGEPTLFHIKNRVHLIGYLGKNPEHRSVGASDRKYAVLSLATQRSWKGADEEWHSKTEWHRVVAWNGLGEYAATKLRKGDHIYVEGTLVSSTFEKEFGKGKSKITVPFKAWQVKADSIRKLNRAKKEQVPDKATVDPHPDEVPF